MTQGNRGGEGGRRNQHYKKQQKVNFGDKGREIIANIDESNPVIQQFRMYGAELDEKHDRLERIIKSSRDVTIESKRTIFLLHTLDKSSKREEVLTEAKSKLENISKTFFKNIALELDGQDVYQYLRAYRAGLQEYVEAVTFYQYLEKNLLPGWAEVQKSLTFDIENHNSEGENQESRAKTVQTLVVPTEFILGIADLTGELMRKCINNLATGDLDSCFQTCNFVREMHSQFMRCCGGKEIARKLITLKQSLIKMENVCYTIKVRGSEIPKHMLVDVVQVHDDYHISEDDEGYQVY